MQDDFESKTYAGAASPETTQSWGRLGVIAAASALAGGLAAAWWYRKTLTKLRQAESEVSQSGISSLEGDQTDDE